MNWLAICVSGVVSGIMGAMGLGGGSVLIIYLTLFTNTKQTTAQGINLIFFIPLAVLAVIIYCKKGLINFKVAIPAAVLGIIGAFIGTRICYLIDNAILKKLFGILLLLMGANQIFFTNKKSKIKK